jgi:hypothetical protein
LYDQSAACRAGAVDRLSANPKAHRAIAIEIDLTAFTPAPTCPSGAILQTHGLRNPYKLSDCANEWG